MSIRPLTEELQGVEQRKLLVTLRPY